MRCQPAFQCRFGLTLRTMDPTGLVLPLDVTHRGTGTSSAHLSLVPNTRHYPQCSSTSVDAIGVLCRVEKCPMCTSLSEHGCPTEQVVILQQEWILRGVRSTEVDIGHDGTQDNLWISKIFKCVLKSFALSTHGCINALRPSQHTSA